MLAEFLLFETWNHRIGQFFPGNVLTENNQQYFTAMIHRQIAQVLQLPMGMRIEQSKCYGPQPECYINKTNSSSAARLRIRSSNSSLPIAANCSSVMIKGEAEPKLCEEVQFKSLESLIEADDFNMMQFFKEAVISSRKSSLTKAVLFSRLTRLSGPAASGGANGQEGGGRGDSPLNNQIPVLQLEVVNVGEVTSVRRAPHNPVRSPAASPESASGSSSAETGEGAEWRWIDGQLTQISRREAMVDDVLTASVEGQAAADQSDDEDPNVAGMEGRL